jgi:hypothetical protein
MKTLGDTSLLCLKLLCRNAKNISSVVFELAPFFSVSATFLLLGLPSHFSHDDNNGARQALRIAGQQTEPSSTSSSFENESEFLNRSRLVVF